MKTSQLASALALFLTVVIASGQDSGANKKVDAPVLQEPSTFTQRPAPEGGRSPVRVLGGGDTCGTAVAIASLPFSDTGNTTGAIDDVTDVSCSHPLLNPSDSGPDLIYSFTVTSGNNLTITVTSTPPYDPSIFILSTCGSGASCVAYADTVPGNPPETINVLGLAPGTYYLYIDSYYSTDPASPFFNPAGAQGPYSLSVTGTLGSTTYNTVAPCRVADTRNPDGPLGGPALVANANRTFAIANQCGIPPTARAVSFNLTITQPTAPGDLRVFPAGAGLPLVSALNWRPGQTRANNAVVTLGPSGDIVAHVDQASGTVHFVIDVNGYFQ